MTSINDDLDDLTVEQLLAGRASTADLQPVAAAVRALREAAAQPVQPSPALRARMAAGAFDGAPADAYRAPGGGRLRGIAAALGASVLRPRLATKLAATGVAVAVLGVGTAGFAGSLPPPVQDGFESVVESISPHQFREETGDPGGGTESAPGESEPGGTDPTPGPTPADGDKQSGNGKDNNAKDKGKSGNGKDNSAKDKGKPGNGKDKPGNGKGRSGKDKD